MVINHPLHIPHNLPIPPTRSIDVLVYGFCFVDAGWLRVEDEGHGEEPFDPFDELVAAVGFECI